MTAKEFLLETSPSLNDELVKYRLRSSVTSMMDDYALDVLEQSQQKWIKIASEDDLPKEECQYEIVFTNHFGDKCIAIADFQFVTRHNFENPPIDKRWFLAYSGGHELTGRITHYRFKPQPPKD